jgi:hypothetical protein
MSLGGVVGAVVVTLMMLAPIEATLFDTVEAVVFFVDDEVSFAVVVEDASGADVAVP